MRVREDMHEHVRECVLLTCACSRLRARVGGGGAGAGRSRRVPRGDRRLPAWRWPRHSCGLCPLRAARGPCREPGAAGSRGLRGVHLLRRRVQAPAVFGGAGPIGSNEASKPVLEKRHLLCLERGLNACTPRPPSGYWGAALSEQGRRRAGARLGSCQVRRGAVGSA